MLFCIDLVPITFIAVWNQFLHSIEIEEVCKNWVLRLKKYLQVEKNIWHFITWSQQKCLQQNCNISTILFILFLSLSFNSYNFCNLPQAYSYPVFNLLFIYLLLSGKFMNAYFWPPMPYVLVSQNRYLLWRV